MDGVSIESTASVFELFISWRKRELTWIALRPNAKMFEILVVHEDLSYRRTDGLTICNLISFKLRQCFLHP